MAKQRDGGRIPPHDLAAEESLLGAVFLSRDALRTAIEMRLATGEFYKPSHQHIWEAVLALTGDRAPVDVVTVGERLRAVDLLDDIGGLPKLLDLQATTPAISNIGRYIRVVQETAARRRIISALADLSERAYDESAGDDVAQIVDHGRSLLGGISSGAITVPSDLMTIGEFVSQASAKPRPWVIPGIMRAMHRCIFVGGEGVGKGVLLRQIALTVASGMHPFAASKQIAPLRTLYADLENSPEVVKHQVELAVPAIEAYGDWRHDLAFILAREGGLNLRTRQGQAELEGAIARCEPSLVVIGPVYKAFRRGPKESYEEAALAAQQFLDDLRVRYEFSLLLEMHAPKGSGGQREMDPKGAQEWMAWPEFGKALVRESKMRRADGTEQRLPYRSVRLANFREDRVPAGWPTHLLGRDENGGDRQLPYRGLWMNGGAPGSAGADDEAF